MAIGVKMDFYSKIEHFINDIVQEKITVIVNRELDVFQNEILRDIQELYLTVSVDAKRALEKIVAIRLQHEKKLLPWETYEKRMKAICPDWKLEIKQ